MMQRRYYAEPPVVQTPLDDVWSVVVPIARTNEVSNPSAETNTTGYTAGAGSLARSTAQQYHGAYSLAYTPSAATTDGFYYTFTSTVALRAVSCKFLGQKGRSYALAYASTAPAELVTYTFTATGRWQWIWLYVNETSATSRRIYFRKNGGTQTATFYVDGVQSEVLASAAETVSTYIDGDQLGLIPNQQPPAYYWNGTPHASTSTRSGLTRAGGQVVKFKDYGFTLMAIIGLGLAAPQNVATEYARIDGGFDDYTRKPTRQFTLSGRFFGRSYQELRAGRGGLADLLDRDQVALDQRLLLLHHVEDDWGNVQTSTSRILAKYQGGLGGNTDGQHAETAPITFTQYLPVILHDGEAGASLTVQQSVGTAARIIRRSADGVWSLFGTGANNDVADALRAPDGKLYVGGTFTSIDGTALSRIGYYSTAGVWTAMGTGALNNAVTGFVLGPDGLLYVTGTFTQMGGVANTNNIARWNPGTAAWASIGTSNGTTMAKPVAGPDGKIYAGGDFTTIGGVAANRIAYWDGAAWNAMGAGLANTVTAIAVGPDNSVYAAVGADAVYRWSGSNWTSIGSNDFTVIVMKFGLNGILYAGGSFSVIGGISAPSIAQWNGVAWSGLGSGVVDSGGGTQVNDILVEPNGVLSVIGEFDTAGGITTVHNIARWNGSAWVYYDMDVAWASAFVITRAVDGSLVIGGSASAAATAAATTTITNTGTARTYPTVVMTGPSSGTARIYQIGNITTGRTIYLNYTINAGETATLVLTPDNLSFTSDFQGNLMDTVLPGSNIADFFLQPGANSITFFAASSTVTATMRWRPAYLSLDDVP